MLKEFIAHIQKTTQPLIHEVEGSTFVINAEGEYQEMLPTIFHPDTLSLNSLDALVKLVKTEASEMDTPLYITIPDHMTVRCFGQPSADERYFRQVYYEAHATDVPGWGEKNTLGFEEAQIALRTRFQETQDTLLHHENWSVTSPWAPRSFTTTMASLPPSPHRRALPCRPMSRSGLS